MVLVFQRRPPRRESNTSLPSAGFATQLHQSRSSSPNLAMAASSMAAAAAARFVPSMVDPQLLGDDVNGQLSLPAKSIEQQLSEVQASMTENYFPSDHQSAWPMLDGSGGHLYPDPGLKHSLENAEPPRTSNYSQVAMNAMNPIHPMTTEFSTEYGNGKKANKHKVRGKFSQDRRKQVQHLRGIGACYRCRMLKKPCSPGTPCSTCKTVESARVWKHPCIRTRIGQDFEMYSAGLHAVLAHQQINELKKQTRFQISPHQIEASHYPETTVYATFSALEGQDNPIQGAIDPGLSGFTTSTRILDHEHDDLPSKLEAYVRGISNVFYAREPSHFMHVTLNTAQELAVNKQDPLLSRALELWSTVHILVDHELRWSLSERVSIDAQAGQGPMIVSTVNDGTYDLLTLQLNAAAEKKASLICKSLLSDVERRLLEKSSKGSFETFLIAIIILNCVEKSTWLFKSWEQESFKSRWPLDKAPVWFASQGEKLADMLQMLLTMRNVAPKTFIRPEDGIIATDSNPVAREYFENLQLKRKYGSQFLHTCY